MAPDGTVAVDHSNNKSGSIRVPRMAAKKPAQKSVSFDPLATLVSHTAASNPAVTIARALSDTYAGIAPAGVLAFIVAQLLGALAANVSR